MNKEYIPEFNFFILKMERNDIIKKINDDEKCAKIKKIRKKCYKNNYEKNIEKRKVWNKTYYDKNKDYHRIYYLKKLQKKYF